MIRSQERHRTSNFCLAGAVKITGIRATTVSVPSEATLRHARGCHRGPRVDSLCPCPSYIAADKLLLQSRSVIFGTPRGTGQIRVVVPISTAPRRPWSRTSLHRRRPNPTEQRPKMPRMRRCCGEGLTPQGRLEVDGIISTQWSLRPQKRAVRKGMGTLCRHPPRTSRTLPGALPS